MDAILAFFQQNGELTAGGILLVVVVLIIAGLLVPIRTHKRELAAASKRGDEWKEAHRVSELGREAALDQNSKLLAGVRIADKFYKDFLPPVSEDTAPPVVAPRDVPS